MYLVVGNYTTIEEISDALFQDKVLGLLVDAFAAGTHPDLFNRSNMNPKTIYNYPTSYGLVLSGPMKNAADFFKGYIADNQLYILDLIKKNAVKMEVINIIILLELSFYHRIYTVVIESQLRQCK